MTELAKRFEIGAHTVDHVALVTLNPTESQRQISQSKQWIESTVGLPCPMFCPPLGKFNALHHRQIAEAGFWGYRTVELLSTDRPRTRQTLRVMPTSVQAHTHGRVPLIKNALKRRNWRNLMKAIQMASGNWVETAKALFEDASLHEGVFHLWGHSWEIDENEQWEDLDRLLGWLAERIKANQAVSLTNAEVLLA
jgi:hypothetical protein